MTTERRVFSRIPFNAKAFLTIAGAHYEAELVDVSLKGALIKMAKPPALAPNAAASVRLVFAAEGEAEPLEVLMEANVVHILEDKMGLLAISMDLDSATHLRRLVELNMGDPLLLERELSAMIH